MLRARPRGPKIGRSFSLTRLASFAAQDARHKGFEFLEKVEVEWNTSIAESGLRLTDLNRAYHRYRLDNLPILV